MLESLNGGNRTVLDAMLPRVYDELRAMAHRQLRGERADHTLDTTALVHEAYEKLVQQDRMTWQNRAHFLSIAALSMRRILLYHRHRVEKLGLAVPAAVHERDAGAAVQVGPF